MLKRKKSGFVVKQNEKNKKRKKKGKRKLCLVQTKWFNFIFNKGKAVQSLICKSSTEVAITTPLGQCEGAHAGCGMSE